MKSNDLHILRIHLNSDEKHGANTLYETLVFEAKRSGIRYAMVQQAMMGYKNDEEMYPRHTLKISQPAPVLVEILDSPQKIRQFASDIEPLLAECKGEPVITITEHDGIIIEPRGKLEERGKKLSEGTCRIHR